MDKFFCVFCISCERHIKYLYLYSNIYLVQTFLVYNTTLCFTTSLAAGEPLPSHNRNPPNHSCTLPPAHPIRISRWRALAGNPKVGGWADCPTLRSLNNLIFPNIIFALLRTLRFCILLVRICPWPKSPISKWVRLLSQFYWKMVAQNPKQHKAVPKHCKTMLLDLNEEPSMLMV